MSPWVELTEKFFVIIWSKSNLRTDLVSLRKLNAGSWRRLCALVFSEVNRIRMVVYISVCLAHMKDYGSRVLWPWSNILTLVFEVRHLNCFILQSLYLKKLWAIFVEISCTVKPRPFSILLKISRSKFIWHLRTNKVKYGKEVPELMF